MPRKAKKVPATVYGNNLKPLSIALDRKDVLMALHHPNALFELEVAGQPARCVVLHEIPVDCLPDRIPASLALDLTPVRHGKAILVRDLTIPAGVHVLTHPDEVVVSPFVPKGEAAGDTQD